MSQNFQALDLIELNMQPSIADLTGVQGTQAIVDYINTQSGASNYFNTNSQLAEYRNAFMNNIVVPIKQVAMQTQILLQQYEEENYFFELRSKEDLEKITPHMQLPMLTHQPLFRLHQQGRVEGWGYDPSDIKRVKPDYDRLIDINGHVDLNIYSPNYNSETKEYSLEYTWLCTDPKYTAEQLSILQDNREFISEFLETSDIDPTDTSNLKG